MKNHTCVSTVLLSRSQICRSTPHLGSLSHLCLPFLGGADCYAEDPAAALRGFTEPGLALCLYCLPSNHC